MLHPAYINLTYYFHATSTTPATCLTQDIPPEQPANILLLSCGDPGNILFTLYNSDPDCGRVVDFTCCEIEPAVLARNVLLYSLLIDDCKANQDNSLLYWNILYNLLLDTDSLQLLQQQSKKLVDASLDEPTWRDGEYGGILRMVSRDTLQQLRGFWQKYADTLDYTEDQLKAYEGMYKEGWDRIRRNHVGTTRVTSGCRTAGPLWMESTRAADMSLKRYWTSGVAGGNETDLLVAKHVNPAFAFSSSPHGAFSLHYGSDPLLGFHSVTSYTNVLQLIKVVSSAKSQFSSWCDSFKRHYAANLITLRFFCGAALNFCLALQERSCINPPRDFSYGFNQPWRATLLKLDGSDYQGPSPPNAPLAFDVIDTGHLSDQMGLLSAIVCAGPLLTKKPSSVIYTESMIYSSEEETSELSKILFGDLTTMTILLNIAPLGHLTAIASQATFHEVGILLGGSSASSRELLHTRIPWKEPILGDSLASRSLVSPKCIFNELELAALLFGIYMRMFIYEMTTQLSPLENGAVKSISSHNHHTRASFAAFLRHIKARTSVNWPKVMEALITKIDSQNPPTAEPSGTQDLYLHCQIFGVTDKFCGNPTGLPIPPGASEFTCLVLTVPRKHLTLFTRMNRRDMGTPPFCASVRSPKFHHTFSSIQPVFGKLVIPPDGSGEPFIIQEDLRGWTGISDMIIPFWVPTFLLHCEPVSELGICLEIVHSPQTSAIFSAALGQNLTIFDASLADSTHVYICPARGDTMARVIPPEPSQPMEETVTPPSYAGVKISPVSVTFSSSGEIDKLKIRLDYHNGGYEHAALKLGSSVDIKQDSPCTVLLGISGCAKHRLAFPYPVNSLMQVLRVSRKSAWIELLVNPSVATDIAGFSLNMIPVLVSHGTNYLVWNMPYIQIDSLPIIDTSRPNNMDKWLSQHIGSMWSDRERKIRNDGEHMDVKMELKESIQTIFLHAAGLGASSRPERVFSLCAPEHGGNHMLIFVPSLRLDLSSQTTVIDAYVLPLTDAMVAIYPRTIARLHRDGIVNIRVGEGELAGWKDMIPSLAERCRTWKHDPVECEYLVSGIPVSIAMGRSPLCSCGKGQQISEQFAKIKEWEPFRKHVTRIALSPLFAVSYIERTTGMVKDMKFFLDTQELTTKESFSNLVQDNVCQNCGAEGKGSTGSVGVAQVQLTRCNRCRTAMYCSQACQKQDWKKHRAECQ
ncbi:hypothetical protein DFH27DRAFT_510162 [Peziza echinospora]|nr:hypothetical protein DFH27DRAFT_510162 [Peziza echinospora]